MRTFAIVLASLPALVLGQFDSLGLQSSTTPTSLASPPSVLAIPSLTESETLCRTEATPCSTTTTAAGLLDILRRDEVSKDGADIVPTPTGTLPESAVLEQVDALSSTLSVKRRHIFRDRDLGLPVLPGVLDATSSEAAPNTTRLPDSEVTPEAIQAIPPFAQKDTAHTTTIAANLKSTFTSYPSPKVTKTDFPFDSAAANGPSTTSASSTVESSETLAARAESTSSKKSTSGLDTDSKYVCSAIVIVTNTTDASDTTLSGTTTVETEAPANATQTVMTAYTCYLRHPNATMTSTQMATATRSTLLTVTTKQAKLTNADVSQSITDTFSVTSLATHPTSKEASTTSSGNAVNDLLANVIGTLRR